MAEFDVIVAGSGAAGLTASVVAAKGGARVLLIESTNYFGGTSARSGGGIWIPGNDEARNAGLSDSLEATRIYLRSVMNSRYDPKIVDRFLETGPEMLDFIKRNTDARFRLPGLPDYESHDGASTGRSLIPLPYDGRRLGSHLLSLRPALPELGVLGIQIDIADVPHLKSAHRSLKSFLYAANLYLNDRTMRFRFGRGVRLTNGNALTAALLKAAIDSGVTLRRNTALGRLIQEDGRVRGIIACNNGRESTVGASRGVILATGGFGANEEMRAQAGIIPANRGWSLQPEGNLGQGIKAGMQAGGSIVYDNEANAIWFPMSAVKRKDGGLAIYPHANFDRHLPGFLVVGPDGRRFVNEGASYQHFGHVMREKGIPRCHLIGDHEAVRRHGIGLVRPYPYPLKGFIRAGYLKRAKTLGALAHQMNVDPEALNSTVRDFNQYALNGEDPEFGKGRDAYSRAMGDPAHEPNPSVGPLDAGPYYAVELVLGELSTLSGLRTDQNAAVLDKTGKSLPGLYAVGVDMNSLWRGAYPGAGASLGPGMTFGYIAAKHILENRE